jgi:hypothetical protein
MLWVDIDAWRFVGYYKKAFFDVWCILCSFVPDETYMMFSIATHDKEWRW